MSDNVIELCISTAHVQLDMIVLGNGWHFVDGSRSRYRLLHMNRSDSTSVKLGKLETCVKT